MFPLGLPTNLIPLYPPQCHPERSKRPRPKRGLLRSRRTPTVPIHQPTSKSVQRNDPLDSIPYFCNYRNMIREPIPDPQILRFADMFSAMGNEARLRIVQLLLQAHPGGLVVGEIQSELAIPGSTLSHHLDKLRHEGLVQVQRESTFLRYTADTTALRNLLDFLYAECCTRAPAETPIAQPEHESLVQIK